jgi:electron transport complex protein RnfG
MNYKKIINAVSQIVIFGIVCIFLVVITQKYSQDAITENKRQYLLKQLNELVRDYENNILADKYEKTIDLYGKSSEITIYPAKKSGKVFAHLIKHTYPKGYSGDITLLTAVDTSNQVIGVRVLEHKETPGLGDKIELKKSQWILSFNGANLNNKVWQVKKKGGDFASFSGATITPQAVVVAVYELLKTYEHTH